MNDPVSSMQGSRDLIAKSLTKREDKAICTLEDGSHYLFVYILF